MSGPHLEVSASTGAATFRCGIAGSIVMLNLLRFHDTADYTAAPELVGDGPWSGRDAFDRYIAHTLPFLRASGGELLLLADGGAWLIGPDDERWNVAMLVRQASVDAFMAWNADASHLAGLGYPTATLADSRLLPLVPLPTDKG